MARFISEKSVKFLSIALFIAIAITPVYAQEVAKDQLYVWNDFSKGLDLKTSPYELPKSWGTTAENVRLNEALKALAKRVESFSYGTADTTEAITGMHRLYLSSATKKLIVTHGDEIEVGDDDAGTFSNMITVTSGDYRWQWLTWHDLAIGTDGYNQPVKTDGTDATYLGSCFAEDAGSGAGPDGEYNYKISYYTSSYEVLYDQVSNNVTVSDNDIDLSMIPIAPDTYGGEDIVGRKVYRSDDGGAGTYNLLTNGTIANNTATTLTDSDNDAACDGEAAYPAGDATYTPPKGKLCVVHKNRLWIANDPTYPSRIYYSEDGNHDTFVDTAYFNVRTNDGDEITFAKNLLGKLTIGKSNTIQKIDTRGDTPSSDWSITDPYSFVGCRAMYTAVNTPIGIIYLSNDGLYKFNGQNSFLISDKVSPVISDISASNFSNCWSALHKNAYYMAYASEASGSAENNRVLIYDLLTNAYVIDLLSFNAFCTFNSGSDWDVLYTGSSTDGVVYSYTGAAANEVLHQKHSDLTGTFDDARYIPDEDTVGGDPDDPVIELSWDLTINNMSGTINAQTGDINRSDGTGTYTSQVLYIGTANAFDKLYWNETIPGAGGDVTFNIRSGASSAACQSASWSSAYTIPSGSDISSETINSYIQYKINLTSTDIDYTPTVYRAGGYVVRITYEKEGATSETTIPLHWTSGYDDFGIPGYTKTLRKLYVFYESESTGTLTIKFTNLNGDSDSFAIDLSAYPSHYTEYFTSGAFTGESFELDISESSLNPLTINRVIVGYDVEPLLLEIL